VKDTYDKEQDISRGFFRIVESYFFEMRLLRVDNKKNSQINVFIDFLCARALALVK
jgi:hypothetical protein